MSKDVRTMSHADFMDWAERWERDVFRLAARRGLYRGRIPTDLELMARALTRRLRTRR